MRACDVMHRQVVYVPQNSTLIEVFHQFQRHHIDCLPIVDAAERVVGLITLDHLIEVFIPRYYELLRDYAVLEDKGQLASLFDTAFSGLDPAQEKLVLAADLMTSGVDWVFGEDSLLQAAARLQAQHYHRLPVVDRDQRLLGVISDFEIVLALLKGSPTAANERTSERSI